MALGSAAASSSTGGIASPWIWRWTTYIADSGEDFDAWIATSMNCMAAGERHTFATIVRATGSAIGSTSFHHYRPQDGVIEIGSTWLNPRALAVRSNLESRVRRRRLD